MHTSEGLELESETSQAGLVLATCPIAEVWVRGVRGRQPQTGLAGTYYGIRRISRVHCLLLCAPRSPQYKRVSRMYRFRHLDITISKES